LAHDLDFSAEQGLVKKWVDFDDLVETSYAHAVVKELGRYKK
jgi:hypothetical protein